MPRIVPLVFVLALTAWPVAAQDRPSPLRTLLDEPTFASAEPERESRPPTTMGGPPMGGRGPGGGMGGGPPGFDVTWYPSRSVSNQPGDLGLVRQGLNVGVPLWRDGGDMLMASASVRNTLFQTDALLPDSGRRFPQQLWNLTFSANYMHQFENGWTGMLMAGFGSASDKPFHSINEVTANLGGFVMIPATNGRDRWQLGLMYMSGGPINFPLPMVSYNWNPSDRLRVNIGLPLSVTWRPTDEWEVSASYAPLYNINARLTYTFAPGVQVHGGYEYLNESYFLADRADRQDRFFGFEQRVVGGVRWQVGEALSVELNGGYGFGRYFGQGSNQWGSLRDRVDVAPGPFLAARFGLRF